VRTEDGTAGAVRRHGDGEVDGGMADGTGRRGPVAAVCGLWALTRALLLVWVLHANDAVGLPLFPGLDVTGDVSATYYDWYLQLHAGTFPVHDVTWQYPPGAALAVLSPDLLPFLPYPTAFSVLLAVADAVVLVLLLRAARRPRGSLRGAWLWVAGVPLLGPTGYARYDLMVTAVAVAALYAGARRPKLFGALAGFGALVKVWPVLLLVAVRRRGRAVWAAAVVTVGVGLGVAAFWPGAFGFLQAQQDRGTEVESLGALVFHVARHAGWTGAVQLNYGSMEFLGPDVPLVSKVAEGLTAVVFGWLLVWRLRARGRPWPPGVYADAGFVAVLLFTTTSRVISPQYMVWLLGIAAVCLARRDARMTVPALLVVAATAVTMLEFPVWFGDVVTSDALGIALLAVRNGLLVAACVTGGVQLWRATVGQGRGTRRAPRHRAGAGPESDRDPLVGTPAASGAVSRADRGDSRASGT
jgi:hypothetical protein